MQAEGGLTRGLGNENLLFYGDPAVAIRCRPDCLTLSELQEQWFAEYELLGRPVAAHACTPCR